jgi:hypothetical protein
MTTTASRPAWELRLAASGVPRSAVLVLLAVVLVVWTASTWPRLTLPFAGAAAPMVDAVDRDVLYDGVGLSDEEADGVRGAIGTRPIVMLFTPERAAGDPRAGDVCTSVDSRVTGVFVVLVSGGEFSYLCGTETVPHRGEWFGFDVYTVTALGRTLTYLDGMPVQQAQSAALLYDAWVRADRLAPSERELRADDDSVLAATGLAAAVVGGIVVAVLALRGFLLLLVSLRVRAERRRRQRELLDDRLAELALTVVAASPADPRRSGAAPAVAAGYLELVVDVREHPGRVAAQVERAEELLRRTP